MNKNLGQEVMGPAYRTAAGMMLCMFFAVTFHHCALSKTFFWNLFLAKNEIMIKVALMILAGLSYLFNSWFSLACITSFPFIALFSYWCGASFQPSFDEHFHRLFPSNCPFF